MCGSGFCPGSSSAERDFCSPGGGFTLHGRGIPSQTLAFIGMLRGWREEEDFDLMPCTGGVSGVNFCTSDQFEMRTVFIAIRITVAYNTVVSMKQKYRE